MNEAAQDDKDAFSWPAAITRAILGFAQGLSLCQLKELSEVGAWGREHPALYAALLVSTAFAPFVLMGGLGRLRPLTLAAWTFIAVAVCAGLGAYDILRGPFGVPDIVWHMPGGSVMAAAVAFLFIAHHLVVPADAARKLIPPYPGYFDAAWKDAVQLILSAAFVGVFWLALILGAALFHLIGITAVRRLIESEWFAFPVTGLALAVAVQLTDVRMGLIRGVRTVGLVLLSWLLPVATFIAVAFLLALPFTGLKPLFDTKSATQILLSAAAGLIVLINAAYQDGSEGRAPAFLRWTGRAAAVALVPLIGIAAFALELRIAPYGLTPERVIAAVCVMIGAVYAVGYAVAAVAPRGGWMQLLEKVNIGGALLILVSILAIFTPVADPARLSVDSQVARLTSGAVTPDRFDFDFLRFQAGRFGKEALSNLAARTGGPRDADIANRAAMAQKREYPLSSSPQEEPQQAIEDRLTVFPTGAALPASFLDQLQRRDLEDMTWCDSAELPCEADVADVDGDGKAEVTIYQPYMAPAGSAAAPGNIYMYRQGPDGRWLPGARFGGDCAALVEALRTGKPALKTGGQEIEAGGRRYDMTYRDSCQSRPAP